MSQVQTLGQWLVSQTTIIDMTSPLYSRIPKFLQDDLNSQLLKNTMLGMFHSYPLLKVYADNNAIMPQIIMNYLATNNYRYTTLYETMELEYNPIENYRMVEEGKDNTTTDVNGTDNYGSFSETSKQAATTDSTLHGSHTDQVNQTQNRTARNDTHSENARTDVATHKVAPEDTTTFYNAEQDDNQIGAKTLTDQYGAYTDTNDTSNIYAQYTDNVNVGERSTTTNRDPYSNAAEQKTLNSFTHLLTRSGNIGVTTSQQMVMSQREVADFNIYQIIATDLRNMLCIRTSIPIKPHTPYYVPYTII